MEATNTTNTTTNTTKDADMTSNETTLRAEDVLAWALANADMIPNETEPGANSDLPLRLTEEGRRIRHCQDLDDEVMWTVSTFNGVLDVTDHRDRNCAGEAEQYSFAVPTLHTDAGDSLWDGQMATDEQITASIAETTGSGYILIDDDGDVIPVGGFGAAGATKVWVA